MSALMKHSEWSIFFFLPCQLLGYSGSPKTHFFFLKEAPSYLLILQACGWVAFMGTEEHVWAL